MKNYIGLELKKVTDSKPYKIALTLSLCIVFWHLISIYGLMQQLYLEAAPGRFTGKYNLFYWWLAIDCVSLPYFVFFCLFPLIACLPYSWSYMNERKTRYEQQCIIRSGKRKYYVSKYVAVFISGGVIIAFPLTIDLLIAALFSPAILPDVAFSMPGFFQNGFLTQLYYSHPWVFCFAFLGMDFLWGGSVACLSFAFALIYDSGFFGVIMPAFLIYIWDFVSLILKEIYASSTGDYLEFSVLRLFHACTNNPNPAWLQLLICGAFLCVSMSSTFILAMRKDYL